MSKTSYALIAVMVSALLYMGAARLHEKWKQYKEAQDAAALATTEPFSFQHKPLSLAAPQVTPMQDPVQYQPQYPQIYLEDTPPDTATQQQQAQSTLFSITQDFDADLKSFNQDLQAATQGQIQNLADLSSQNLAQLVQENPQIVKVVQKHLNNKEFAAKINEIFSNPQFQQSVQQLQQTPAGLPTPPAPQTPILPVSRLTDSN